MSLMDEMPPLATITTSHLHGQNAIRDALNGLIIPPSGDSLALRHHGILPKKVLSLTVTMEEQSFICDWHHIPSHKDLDIHQLTQAFSEAPQSIRCALMESIAEDALDGYEQQLGEEIHITHCLFKESSLDPFSFSCFISASPSRSLTLRIPDETIAFFADRLQSLPHKIASMPILTVPCRVLRGTVSLDKRQYENLTAGDMIIYGESAGDKIPLILCFGKQYHHGFYDDGSIIISEPCLAKPQGFGIESAPLALPLSFLERDDATHYAIPYEQAMTAAAHGNARLCDEDGRTLAYGSDIIFGSKNALLLRSGITE